jgi:hypothetical protein
MEVLKMYSDMTRMWIFIGFQWALFSLQYIIQVYIPDEPLEVEIQKQRTEFLVSKILLKAKDDDDDVIVSYDEGEKPQLMISQQQPECMIYNDEL